MRNLWVSITEVSKMDDGAIRDFFEVIDYIYRFVSIDQFENFILAVHGGATCVPDGFVPELISFLGRKERPLWVWSKKFQVGIYDGGDGIESIVHNILAVGRSQGEHFLPRTKLFGVDLPNFKYDSEEFLCEIELAGETYRPTDQSVSPDGSEAISVTDDGSSIEVVPDSEFRILF